MKKNKTVDEYKAEIKEKRTVIYENRELSWLRFNERVLEEAEGDANPLGEKLNFLTIFQTNMDEFFMVRVGSLYDQMVLNDYEVENKTYMRPSEQIEAIAKQVKKLAKRHALAYRNAMAEIDNYGIHFTDFLNIDHKQAQYLQMYFKTEVQPLLTPMVIAKKQPIPFMENEDLYAFCTLEQKGDKDKIGIVPTTQKSLPRLVPVPGKKGEFMLMEELILHFLPLLFRAYTVREKAVIRITRNADIDADAVYDEDLDYRELMTQLIKSRRRLLPVRLEYSRKLTNATVNRLCELLEMNPMQAFYTERPLDLRFLSQVRNELYKNPELFYEKRQPQLSDQIDPQRTVTEQVLEKDVLLSYPYERMDSMIQLLEEAAKDPQVESIQMTLYRLAKNSQIVAALVRAVENGKNVTVLVELKARFDEENNIHWTHMLEDAGCKVYYGLGQYKVHSKLLLITRRVEGKKEYITQIGTGNYNENTARLYADLCYMTARKSIGEDAEKVFEALWAGEFVTEMKELLVAPKCLQNRILDLIDGEIMKAKAGRKGYIGLKVNSMTDKAIMEKLVEAGKAGVQVDLIIRGINCLRSQIPGETENIHVYSIVGRFLEHARIYIFGVRGREKMYIASADMMTRNTLRRVEVATPIHDRALRGKIRKYFELQMKDNVKARAQNPKGVYEKKKIAEGDYRLNSQEEMYKTVYQNANK